MYVVLKKVIATKHCYTDTFVDVNGLCFQHKELEQYLMQPKGDYNPDLPIDEQTTCISYDPKWEFPKDRLRLGNHF